jgi:hypothetical protein
VVVARCCRELNLQGCIAVIPTNKHREALVATVMMVHPAPALAVVSIAPFMYLWLMIVLKCGSCSDVLFLLRGMGIKAQNPTWSMLHASLQDWAIRFLFLICSNGFLERQEG